MISTRALFTGTFTDLPGLGIEQVFSSPDFFWNDINDPRAVYHDGTTYMVGIQEDGDVRVAAVDDDGTEYGPYTVFSGDTSVSGNIHHSVAICRRASDGKLLVAYCKEGDDQINIRISDSAGDVSAWGSVIGAGGSSSYTYVSFYQLDNGDMYLLTKRTSGWVIGSLKSTDGGATWGSFTSLVDSGGKSIYWRAGLQGNRIHLFVTDTDRSDGDPSSVYHFYLEGDILYDSEGNSVGLPGDVATDGTLVQDDTPYSARPEGWAIWEGQPCVLIKNSQVDRDPSTLRVCRWSGSAWVNKTVVTTDSATFYSAMRKDNPWWVYMCVLLGGKYEMRGYRSTDEGDTWTTTDYDHGSGLDNGAPDTPLDAGAGMEVIWGRGSGLTDSDFEYGVMKASV